MYSIGAKKRLRLLRLENSEKIKKKKYDPNTVGLEESSEQSSDEEADGTSYLAAQKNQEIALESNHTETVQNSIVCNTNIDVEKAENSQKGNETSEIDLINKVKVKTQINKNTKKDIVKKPLTHETTHIEVKRDPKVQVARLKLPILGEEQRIMELINENEFIIVAGETGMFIYYFCP